MVMCPSPYTTGSRHTVTDVLFLQLEEPLYLISKNVTINILRHKHGILGGWPTSKIKPASGFIVE